MTPNVWSEPLTADSRIRDPWTFDTIVRQGDGSPVAGVRCTVNTEARTGWFGDMIITDRYGGPKQTLRALVLLTREALRQANDLGIRRVRTEVPPRLLDFARRMTALQGDAMDADAARTLIAGELAQIRTRTLDTSDADGNLQAL